MSKGKDEIAIPCQPTPRKRTYASSKGRVNIGGTSGYGIASARGGNSDDEEMCVVCQSHMDRDVYECDLCNGKGYLLTRIRRLLGIPGLELIKSTILD